jgi:putative ABC transport system ATP-binding protein
MTRLIVEHVAKQYPTRGEPLVVLRDVSLELTRGENLAVLGPSGSGKSTLLNILGCLDRPTTGKYLLGGHDVATLDDAQLSELRNRHIGFIFQSFNLIAQLTVLENIEVPLFYQGMPRRDRRERSRELAERVGLGRRLQHRPRQLSGGQQQRVAIARSMANDPLILLADEPTGNLDSHTSDEILAIFSELHGQGRTLVMITHEEDVARHSRRVVRLHDGQVASDLPLPEWTRAVAPQASPP